LASAISKQAVIKPEPARNECAAEDVGDRAAINVVDSFRDSGRVAPHHGPKVRRKYHDGKCPTVQLLLRLHRLIAGHECVGAKRFNKSEKVAVLYSLETGLANGADLMTGRIIGQRLGNAFVQDDLQGCNWCSCASR
jgi:hypothetical protein